MLGLAISSRPMVGPVQVQRRPSTRIDKMIATCVTESYAKLFLNAKGDNPHVVIDRVGAYEVRLLEIPSTNARGAASLWVELYDLDLRLAVDSYKCNHVDEAIDATHLLMVKAKLLNGAGEAAPSSFEGL